jgi:hypothetical protein
MHKDELMLRLFYRLKSRQDLRWVFDSTSMYFRALHAITTGRYRLSTKKFIFDLFDFQLDSGLVKQLNGMADVLVMDEQDVYVEELLGRRRGTGLSGIAANGNGFGMLSMMEADADSDVDGEIEAESVPAKGTIGSE